MVVRRNGVIRGRHVDLERETGLIDGSAVTVNIEPLAILDDVARRAVLGTSGAWAGDPSIEAVFEDIERERSLDLPRDVDFDAPS